MAEESYTIRSVEGGISDRNSKGIPGSFKFGYGLDIHGRDDVLKCGQALVKESAAIVTDLIRFIIPCSDGNAYGFGDTGKIYKRKGTTWTLQYTDANGEIKGAYEWNGYLWWACDTEISRILVSEADDGTWNADVDHDWDVGLTAADWHTMLIASGALMICNDKFLALIDYAGPTFAAEALNLYPGNVAKCLDEDGIDVIIGTTDAGNAEKGYLQTWRTSALNWIKKKKFASKGVNALITTELMLAQCGIDGEVYFSDMVNKVPVFSFPGGGSAMPGGVSDKNGLAMFGISGNSSDKCGIYSYGRRRKNAYSALNLSYVGSHGKITGITYGAVQMVDGTLLVAWKDSTTYGVDALSTSVKANGVYESLEWDRKLPMTKKMFKQTKMVMKPLPAGCSIVFKYKINGETSWVTAKTVDGNSSVSASLGTITMTIANPCVVTLASHGLLTGDRIMFTTTNALPTGITASTYYFVKRVDANTFNLYDTKANAVAAGTTGRVTTTGAQAGVHTGHRYIVRALFNINQIGEVIELQVNLTSSGNNSAEIKSVNNYFDYPKGSNL